MSDQATAWQTLLLSADDAMSKELLCVQRRYHGQLVETTSEKGGVRTCCFMALSDPDLPPEFKGESEIFVFLSAKYPEEAAQLDLTSWKQRMTQTQFAALNDAVAARANELRGTFGIRKLLTWLDNNILRILQASAPVEDAKPEPEVETAAEVAVEEPVERSLKACRYLMRGKCKSGDKCKFSHEKAKELKKKKQEKQAKQAEVEAETKETAERVASPVANNGRVKATKNEEPTAEDGESKETKKSKKANKSKEAKEPKDSNDSNDFSAAKESTDSLETKEQKMKAKKLKAKAKKQAKQPCKFFLKGACRDGEQCKFSHETSTAKETKPAEPKKKVGITIAVIGEAPASPTRSPRSAPNEAVSVEETAVESTPKVPSAEDWTAEQQRALDQALKKYPATMEKRDRWVAIASEVEDKTLNDCIDRFQLLSQLVKTGASIPIAATVTQSPPPVMNDESDTKDASTPPSDNQKIIPEDKRVRIETEPVVSGAQIRLEELFLYQIGTVIPHSIVCQVQCTHCPLKFDATLTLENASLQKWCPRCSTKHVVVLRPAFTHAQSNVLAYVDTENCAIVDILPSDVLASCLECGKEALLEKILPGRRSEQSCFSCHTKLAMMTKRVAVGYVSSGEGMPDPTASAGSSASAKPTKTKRIVDTFVLGQPLPRNGVCDHYKHSQRWFRFQCCGKAFPCDVCHDSSDCEQANTGKIASKIICGLCSKEQASSTKECSCGNEVGRHVNRSRHWEGGQGCRDATRMSANDKQKFRGKNKTESQKQKRVGVVGKIRTMTTSAEKRSS